MKLQYLLWLILYAGLSGVTLDAQRAGSPAVHDQFPAALSGVAWAAEHDDDERQTRGRRRSVRDRDDDGDSDSDNDSDSDDRNRNRRPRWGGFPFPDRDRNSAPRRFPRGQGRNSVEAIATDNGYLDGYDKGLEDGRDQRDFDPARHRWYRSADRGYNSRYSRAQYARVYREAFREGYDAGYRDGDRNTRGRNGGWSIPWPWPF